MLLARRSLLYAAVCFQSVAGTPISHVHAADEKSMFVQYVVQRREEEPKSGEVSCEIGRFCALVKQEKPDFSVELKISREQRELVGKLYVHCWTECSFTNLYTYLKPGDTGRFEIRSGDLWLNTPLVLKPSKRMGEIVVRFRPAGT